MELLSSFPCTILTLTLDHEKTLLLKRIIWRGDMELFRALVPSLKTSERVNSVRCRIMRNRMKRTPRRRKPKTTILIVCEGRETERNYLDGLKRLEAISQTFAIKVVAGKGGTRSQIVKRAIDKKNAQRKEMDAVLCVLDTESLENPQVKEDLAVASPRSES